MRERKGGGKKNEGEKTIELFRRVYIATCDPCLFE